MDHVGPFRLDQLLGQGGMGKVYRATHQAMRLPVALKALDPTKLELERGAKLLAAEVRAMARLDHPHIGRVLDHGIAGAGEAVSEGTAWYAMELLSSDLTREARHLRWDGLQPLIEQLLDALAHAHSRGVVHRDLKASNVLFGRPGDARPGLKLVDFGIAASGADSLRRAGSPSTMAPEQYRRDLAEIGPWTDLYALGGLVWRLVTGSRPTGDFRGPELQLAKLDCAFVPFAPRYAVPSHLEGWLRRCLQPDPGERFASAAAAHADLAGHSLAPRTWRDPDPTPLPRGLAAAGHTLLAWREPVVTGQEEARDALWQALRAAARDGQRAARCLTGAEGVGASAIGRWWVERAHARTRAFTAHVVAHADQPADAGVQRLVDAILQPLGDPRSDEGRVRGLSRLRLAHLELAALTDPAPLLPHLVEACATLLEALCQQRPLALFFDDAHLDPGLTMLAARLREGAGPIMVVTREPIAPPGVTELRLRPLRSPELSEVLARLLPLEPVLHAELLARAHGSPARLREQLLVLRDRLTPSEHGFTHPLPLPEPRAAVEWLEALDEPSIRLLEVAAVLGPDVAVSLWAVAADVPASRCLLLLERLEGWGWVPAGSPRLALPPAVVDGLQQRARDHRRFATACIQAASALEALGGDPLTAGRCWRDAGLPADAARCWLTGWRRLVRRHGPRVALGAMEAAEGLLADVPEEEALHGERLRIELELRFFLRESGVAARARAGEAWAASNGWADTAAVCARAIAFADHEEPAKVVATYERLHATWFDRCSPRFQADLLVSWYFHAERFAQPNRDALYADAMARLEALDQPHMRRLRLAVRTMRLLRDADPEAVVVAREAVTLSQQYSPLQLCQDWSQLGWAHQQQGEILQAERAFREAAAAARWLDQPHAHTWAIANLAGLAAIDGRFEVAARRAQRALAGSDLPYINAVMRLLCAVPLAQRGRWSDLRALWPDIATHVPKVVPPDPEVEAAVAEILRCAERELHPFTASIRALLP